MINSMMNNLWSIGDLLTGINTGITISYDQFIKNFRSHDFSHIDEFLKLNYYRETFIHTLKSDPRVPVEFAQCAIKAACKDVSNQNMDCIKFLKFLVSEKFVTANHLLEIAFWNEYDTSSDILSGLGIYDVEGLETSSNKERGDWLLSTVVENNPIMELRLDRNFHVMANRYQLRPQFITMTCRGILEHLNKKTVEIIDFAYQNGGRLNTQLMWTRPHLCQAVEKSMPSTVSALIKAGSPINIFERDAQSDIPTPIFLAAKRADAASVEIFMALVNAGATHGMEALNNPEARNVANKRRAWTAAVIFQDTSYPRDIANLIAFLAVT